MNVLDSELIRIYRRDGKLFAEQVLSEATDPASPLHTHFTWDDSAAAHQWRLEEARALIRRPEVIRVIDNVRYSVPAFVHIDPDPGYVSTADALNDADLSARLFAQLHRDVQNLIARYERFQAAASLVEHMREWLSSQPSPKRKRGGGIRRR